MTTEKLTSTDAFVVFDLPQAAAHAGVVRVAPKVLVDGATWLARSQTYQFAAIGLQVGGASAGINVRGLDRDECVTAFLAEIEPWVASGRFLPDPGKGLDEAELASLAANDTRRSLTAEERISLLAAGVAAAAAAARPGGLEGARVAIEEVAGVGPQLAAEVERAGGEVVAMAAADDVVGVESDVLVVGSKPGLVDHQVAARVRAPLLVPCGPIPVTAKALAVLGRAGTVVLPDFVTTAGPTLVAFGTQTGLADAPVDEVARMVGEAVGAVLQHPSGPLLGACELAEEFLASWCDELPFGRPLA